MLIPQGTQSRSDARDGKRASGLAELRSRLANPLPVDNGTRQRLCDLARRLARVQALGGEYARIRFSEHAAAAMTSPATP